MMHDFNKRYKNTQLQVRRGVIGPKLIAAICTDSQDAIERNNGAAQRMFAHTRYMTNSQHRQTTHKTEPGGITTYRHNEQIPNTILSVPNNISIMRDSHHDTLEKTDSILSRKYQAFSTALMSRDAEPEPEPEPEPPEPTHFGRSRSRSRSRRNGLLGAGAGAGAVKNGAAPAPKMDTIVEK